jgi:hypothetical protein
VCFAVPSSATQGGRFYLPHNIFLFIKIVFLGACVSVAM